ncbi:MAG: patatin-like phospholipase family protein, partial [Pseudomonadota bacterium]
EIMDRLNEITFNATLLREMRAVAFVKRLIHEGKLDRKDYKDVRMHRIDGAEALAAYPAGSKLSSDWRTLTALHDIGRSAAKGWTDTNYDALGNRATLRLQDEFA